MADDNQQWPSENEDFDAVTNGAPTNTLTEQPKSVTISTPDDDADEPADEAPVTPKPADEPQPVKPVASTPPPAAPVKTGGPKSGNVGRIVLEVVLLIIIVALGLWAWTLRSDNTSLKNQVTALNNNPQITIQKQTQELIAKVAKLIQLPSGETPTIANVTDAAAAKKQSAFFANAQNGDKVLMYVKAGEAILYRPSTNKIVLVAPLTFNNSAATSTSTTTTKK